ncbi:MAG: thioredoxin family protein [Planctomycetes bacterium]|nr:thioredoxin family protein [Planctomycetota bacterium]
MSEWGQQRPESWGGTGAARRGSGGARRWVPALLVVGVMGLYALAMRPAPPPEGWDTDFERAAAEASSTGRNMLLAFHMPGCPPCLVMERKVLSTDEVARAAADLVRVRVDATRQPAVAMRYNIQSTPTFVIADAQGAPLARTEGAMSVEAFVRFLKAVPAISPPSP